MFDRIFNILKAEIGDAFQSNEKISKEDWELYEQFQKNKKQEEYQNFNQNFDNNSNQQPSWQQQQEERQYYAALELPNGASFEEVKVAYKKMIKQYHPDRFHNDPEKHKAAVEISQKLNIAYSYFEKKFGK